MKELDSNPRRQISHRDRYLAETHLIPEIKFRTKCIFVYGLLKVSFSQSYVVGYFFLLKAFSTTIAFRITASSKTDPSFARFSYSCAVVRRRRGQFFEGCCPPTREWNVKGKEGDRKFDGASEDVLRRDNASSGPPKDS